MSKRPALSRAELEVARIVWERGPSTVREVFDALPDGREIDFKTAQTYLRRLEAKGYLQTRFAGKNKVYSARVKPSRVVREAVDDFISRLFDGEAMPLFQHLIEDRGLSGEEIAELRRLIERSSERGGRDAR